MYVAMIAAIPMKVASMPNMMARLSLTETIRIV
jgi:hypothetical protein